VRETPKNYEEFTKPYIDSLNVKDIQWVGVGMLFWKVDVSTCVYFVFVIMHVCVSRLCMDVLGEGVCVFVYMVYVCVVCTCVWFTTSLSLRRCTTFWSTRKRLIP
jgi:hypothetical protein